MRIVKKVIPYLIGFLAGVFMAKSEKGNALLSKLPFMKSEA